MSFITGGAGGISPSGGSSGIGSATSGSSTGSIQFGNFNPGGSGIPKPVMYAALAIGLLWIIRRK